MKKLLFITLSLYHFITVSLYGQLHVDIIAGNAEPIAIAVARIDSDDANRREADQIRQVIEDNLRRSGLFRIIDTAAHPERLQFDTMPRFADWSAVNARNLVQARVTRTEDKELRLQFYVWDIPGKEQVEAQSLVADAASLRRLGHIASDAIYSRLTGEGGYFDTQIVLTAQTGRITDPKNRLAIMDSDGYNFRFISDENTFVMTPHFSPNMHSIVFLSFRGNRADVWTLDMNSGEQRRLAEFPGMNFAPRFSPCGGKVALSIVEDGITNLWEYDIEKRTKRRLTNKRAISTSPTYSPDGRFLVYNSDVSGNQQLHRLDLRSLKTERLSYGSGRYATPAFSPDGNWIAFTKIERGTFMIGVMSPNGRNERILASGWYMEGPSWAPNSRRLVYYQTDQTDGGRGRTSTIRSVDILGHFNYEIPLPRGVNGMDPTWSPLLP